MADIYLNIRIGILIKMNGGLIFRQSYFSISNVYLVSGYLGIALAFIEYALPTGNCKSKYVKAKETIAIFPEL